MRKIVEWIGKTDDAQIPPRVRLRIFNRYGGHCHVSGIKIRPGDAWHCDHIVALCNGGQHVELNLAPVLTEPHKEKTKLDIKEKSKVAKKRMHHLGIRGKKRTIAYRKFDGTPVPARYKKDGDF